MNLFQATKRRARHLQKHWYEWNTSTWLSLAAEVCCGMQAPRPNLHSITNLCGNQRCSDFVHIIICSCLIWWWWLLLYSAILCSRADSLRSHAILHEWLAFYSAFLNIHRSGVLRALAWLVPRETAAISAQVLCTPYNHAPCHFMQSYICKVYVCLPVTCHLHFWQNDRDLLCATAVTRRWNRYQNKSQHRKLTLENKILPPLLQGFEPATFQSWVRRSNHWTIPLPRHVCV